MTTEMEIQQPYKPNFIHTFYGWIGRLPIPEWLFFLLLLPAIGIAQHLVAWSRGLLAVGQFNLDLGIAGIYLGSFFIGIYVLKGAPKAFDEYRPVLDATDAECARLKYQFVIIPRGPGTLFFLFGVAISAVQGFSDMAVAPAVDYAFPQMRMGIWMISGGVFFLFGYQVVRQLRQIGALYAMPERIDLFNPRPLYGFSRYTATLGVLTFIIFGTSFIDPTAFIAYSSLALIIFVSVLFLPILLIFYLPLAGAHRRLVSEKDSLLQQVGIRIETILERIHMAAFEEQDYTDVGGMRAVLSAMREEKETIQSLSTWPWKPGTLTGLLSALFIPVVLLLIREFMSRLLD